MNNDLSLFDEIIFGPLRPWLRENKSGNRYRDLLEKIVPVAPRFPMFYKVEFLRPFNPKTRYYLRLIQNQVIRYCNRIYDLRNEGKTKAIHAYRRKAILCKKLPERLTLVGEIIYNRDYFWDNFDPRKPLLEIDPEFRCNAFIIQYLKISLVHIYLEVQEIYSFISKKDFLIEKDFYPEFFKDVYPEEYFINKAVDPTPHRQQLPVQNQSLTFGFKNRSTKSLELIVEHLNFRMDFLNTDRCSIKDFIQVMTSKDLEKNTTAIHLGCETKQFRYIMDKLKLHFSHLTLINIERSKAFYSKKGNLITATNLARGKAESPKAKEEIDEIFRIEIL